MSMRREQLRQFQEQQLESRCGADHHPVPKAGCVSEWALVEIALNLQQLNDHLARLLAVTEAQALAHQERK